MGLLRARSAATIPAVGWLAGHCGSGLAGHCGSDSGLVTGLAAASATGGLAGHDGIGTAVGQSWLAVASPIVGLAVGLVWVWLRAWLTPRGVQLGACQALPEGTMGMEQPFRGQDAKWRLKWEQCGPKDEGGR